MEQLLLHLWGDYITQTDWMATKKTTRWFPAVLHGLLYTLPFLLLTQSPAALAVIGLSHILIDRFRLARFVTGTKNGGTYTGTGYPADTPPWMAVWLLIIVDNTLHLTINYACLRWLP